MIIINSYRFGAGVDVDAQNYIDALHSVTADLSNIHNSLSDTQLCDAINQFFKDCKGIGSTTNNSNFYSKLKILYPIIGASVANHKWNAVNPVDTDGAFRATFSGNFTTWTHNSSGVKHDNAGYINTKLIPASYLSSGNHSAGVYVAYKSEPDMGGMFGAFDDLSTRWAMYWDGNTSIVIHNYANSGAGKWSVSHGRYYKGLYQHNMLSGSSKILERGSSLGTDTTSGGNFPSVRNFYFMAINNAGGTLAAWYEQYFKFCYLSTGLTDNELQDIYYAIQKLQTTLGRAES